MEKNKVIELLPNREAKTLKKWLIEHPTVETMSRDRSSTYASAITEADRDIIQIADRWHILNNVTEGFEQFLNTQRQSIKQVAVELKSQNATEMKHNPMSPDEMEKSIQSCQMPLISKYNDKFLKNKQLQSEGHSKRKIAKLLEMSRNTINRYWNRTVFLSKVNHKKSNILDDEDYLTKRWN